METGALLRSFAIGMTCGLRSMTGPAVMSWRARDPARLALAGLAAGELIADKLPATPARTVPPALIFRAISGGLAGRSVSRSFAADARSGLLAGALGAVIAAYAGMALRGRIVRASGLPDPFVALAEDAVAVGGAIAASAKPAPQTDPGTRTGGPAAAAGPAAAQPPRNLAER
jgi:uncharacterized membrane protein